MIVLLNVPAGHEVLVGAPANPMSTEDSQLIAQCLHTVPDLAEAHLPQVFIEGVMDTARQVLVIVLERPENADAVVGEVGDKLSKILSEGTHLDLWPLTDGSGVLEAIRGAHCSLPFARYKNSVR